MRVNKTLGHKRHGNMCMYVSVNVCMYAVKICHWIIKDMGIRVCMCLCMYVLVKICH